MKIVIDIGPPKNNFCENENDGCRMLDSRMADWCNLFNKSLDDYQGLAVRCTECHEAEREAKNDCKNNADA